MQLLFISSFQSLSAIIRVELSEFVRGIQVLGHDKGLVQDTAETRGTADSVSLKFKVNWNAIVPAEEDPLFIKLFKSL